jgi:hypothetical protein
MSNMKNAFFFFFDMSTQRKGEKKFELLTSVHET